MRVRKTTIPALTLLLDVDDGFTLREICVSHLIQLKGGKLGSGTSVDDEIRWCEALVVQLNAWIEGEK